jgi:predicted secreted Zn-dependent protease
MTTIARLMALAALACLASQPARAETITSKTFAYFSVGGRTAAELDEELSKRGPMMKHSGSRHPGATRIKWGGSVTYVRRGSRCAVGQAQVTPRRSPSSGIRFRATSNVTRNDTPKSPAPMPAAWSAR